MIIIKIKHGLGNQLFQYAIGRSISLKLNSPLKFDISHYHDKGLRKFELHYFNYPQQIDTNIAAHLDEAFYLYEEPHFHFDKKSKTVSLNTYLDGFWQTEKYFTESSKIFFSVKNSDRPFSS